MSHFSFTQRIKVIDSHTGGEPTRVVIEGGPDLGNGSLAEQRTVFEQRFDCLRSAIVNEPRGSDVWVGAVLRPPQDADCIAGVIFFNNVGCLGMCIHGTIGVMVSLAYQRQITPGHYRLETPVGIVAATLEDDNCVSVQNVPSFRYLENVRVPVEGHAAVTGDVAWGGNWFFLVNDHGEEVVWENVERLTDVAWRIRQGLARQGVVGPAGEEIDHVELFGPPHVARAASKNFVLCPGKAYDRSPCGTGTSAKLACLIADGRLAPGGIWRQEGILGSVFEGSATVDGDRVIPTLSGSAYITAESTLMLQADDPYQTGLRP